MKSRSERSTLQLLPTPPGDAPCRRATTNKNKRRLEVNPLFQLLVFFFSPLSPLLYLSGRQLETSLYPFRERTGYSLPYYLRAQVLTGSSVTWLQGKTGIPPPPNFKIRLFINITKKKYTAKAFSFFVFLQKNKRNRDSLFLLVLKVRVVVKEFLSSKSFLKNCPWNINNIYNKILKQPTTPLIAHSPPSWRIDDLLFQY